MMMDVWELRRETERPEAVDAGTVAMAGVDPDRVYDVVWMLLRGGACIQPDVEGDKPVR